jgi:hypothetical protein
MILGTSKSSSGAGGAEGVQDYYGADGEGDYGREGGDQHQGWVQVEDVGENGGYGEDYACGVQEEWGARRGLRRRGLGCGAEFGTTIVTEVGTKIGAEAALQ